MGMWNEPPPEPRNRAENWPTLLYSWWCSAFCAVIIIIRLCSRKVRSGRLFKEDWIMMLAMIPLFIRMALIHLVLIWGTNNVRTVGHHFTDVQLEHRETGARLVLAARISYAAFIWTSKLTVSEFLKRITLRIWRRSYEVALQGIRIFLLLTFIAVVIATLTECQPFDHYWQVIPDPGPHCRSGYAQLITMGTCDIITDVLLIAFPIPIVLRSGQSWKRKLQLALLFSLSVAMIAVTATRVPEVIWHHGRQQYRTVWASSEILASTAVSNAIIIGSFLRDKGSKKNKFRSQSVSDSIERVPTRRSTMTALQRVGSDEDLFRFLGCRVPAHLLDEPDTIPRPAQAALSAKEMRQRSESRRTSEPPRLQTEPAETEDDRPDSPRRQFEEEAPSPVASTKRSVSFFDVGGLLEDGAPSWDSRSRTTTLVDSGAPGTAAHDFAPPSPAQSRRGSRTFLTDIGAFVSPAGGRSNANGFGRRHSDAQANLPRHRGGAPMGVLGPMIERHESPQSLQDAGGLLRSRHARPESPLGIRGPGGLLEALSEGPAEDRHATTAARSRPRIGREASDRSLQDVGGILSDGHAPDAIAAGLRRVADRSTGDPGRVMHSPARSHYRAPDETSLHDPGGLLGDG